MPVRFKPGEVVHVAGTYVLIDRSDRPVGVAVRFEEGQRLPLAVADDGPIGYVLVGLTETAQLA